jgi:hypothetical protein
MNVYDFTLGFFVLLLVLALVFRRKRLHKLHPELFLPLTWKQRIVLFIIPTMLWFFYHYYILYPETGSCVLFETGFSGLIFFFLPFYYLIFVVPLAFILPKFVEGNRDTHTQDILKFGLFMYPASMVFAGITAKYICNIFL